MPTLDGLRKGLTAFQKLLAEELWSHFFEKIQWPSTRSLYSRHEKQIVRSALSPLTGNIVTEHQNNGQNEIVLTLLGVLLTEKGGTYQELLSRFFELQRDLFRKSPDLKSISSEEVGNTLTLSPHELKVLGLLVRLAGISGGYGGGDNPSWNASTMAEAEDFPYGETFLACVERWALRFYNPGSVVFKDERPNAALNLADPGLLGSELKPGLADHDTHADNPLKKRYQVFVSSTYEDLIEERKHVMQALLATKCIPSGMELFPAANAEQWEVIKSVIDDCDYYVVIVAGKYGSIGSKGKSYTEMEFDYAVKKQKSILGFYFSDMQSLPAKKIELSEQRRTQLQDFTQKVKSRMCQGWISPEGLASALKTAILHAMETDPKSGWVRSSEVPSWQMVNSLKERIAELENKKLPKKTDEKNSTGKELFEFAATVVWHETDVSPGADGKRKYFNADFGFKMTWDALLLCLPLKAGKSTTEPGLKKRFQNELAKLCRGTIEKKSKQSRVNEVATKIQMTDFENIFQTFVARGYFVSTTKNVGTYYYPSSRKKTLWRLTQRGIRKLAACKTERLDNDVIKVMDSV